LNRRFLLTASLALLLLVMLLPALTVIAYEEIGPGTYTGSLGVSPDVNRYQIMLNKDEHVKVELDGPTGAGDFDLIVWCKDYEDSVPGHSAHLWFSQEIGSTKRRVEFTVPHSGLYCIQVGPSSSSGPYTLVIEIPNRVSGGGLDMTLIVAIVGVVAVVAIVAIFLLMRRRAPPPAAARPPPPAGVAFYPKCCRGFQ